MIFVLGLVFALLQTGAAGVVSRRDSTLEVFFRASLSSGSTIGLGSNVRFDQVKFQRGECYNPTSGVFTAPVSGLYQFMVHVQSMADGISSYRLMNQGKSEMHTSIHSAYDAASFTTIIQVKKGDHVSVRKTYEDHNAKMFSSTQFAGYLLHKD